MKTTSIMPAICALALAVLPTTALQANQEKVAAAIRDTRAETLQTGQTLRAAVEALDAMAALKTGDLKPAYAAFVDKVGGTRAAADVTRQRVDMMSANSAKYFQTWQETVNGISNASLKKSAQKRLDTVKVSFDKIYGSLQQATQKFGPFLSDLNDVQKALALDTTPGGVKSVKDVVSSAKSNFNKVAEAVNAAIAEMTRVEKALSTQAG
jgi:hypothetical protein